VGRRLSAFWPSSKRKSLYGLATLLAVGLIAWHASLRQPTGPAEGGPIHPSGQAAADKPTFRLGTFNIHRGRDAHGQLNLLRTAKALQGLDFVGLNEVGGHWPWQPADQAQTLGQLTDRAWLFAPFERRWYCYEFGNALLSSLPIRDWRRLSLGGDATQSRNITLATVGAGQRTLRAMVVHVSRRATRAEELRSVFSLFQATRSPVVLLGDLNTTADDPQLRQLLATPGVVDALASASGVSPGHIDWILLRGLRPVRAGMVDEGASDHPLFWAEVEFLPEVQ
jgi:endonuclease/exonuclease/phosphatase family metal-dependent hydrolase